MTKLKQKYGFWAAFALTLTGTIGSSLLVSFNMVTFLSGFDPLFLVLAWLLGGLVILPENLLMIEPAINYHENGTTYAWVKKAGWKVIAFWFGWVLVTIVSAAALAGISIALGQLSSIIIDNMTKTTHLIDNEWIGKGIGLGFLAILVVVQIFVKNSSKYTQYLFWALTILPVLFVLLMAMVYGNFDQTLKTETAINLNKSMGAIFLSSGMLIPAITYTSYSYSGVEFSTYIAGEIKEPKKTLPKVILFSVIAIVVIYVVYGIALLSLTSIDKLGSDPAVSPVPVNLTLFPAWAKIVFQVMAIFLFIGSINTLLVTYTGLVYKLSEERDLFKQFKKLNKNNVAWMAMLFIVAVALIYVLSNDLYKIVGYFTISVSLLKIIMATTTVYLRNHDKDYEPLYKKPFFYILLGLSYCTALLILGGGIAAIFFLQPIVEDATRHLVFDIIFLVVLVAIIPIGYIKFYFQDYRLKKQIRQKLGLKTNKELRALYFHDAESYSYAKKNNDQIIDLEIKKHLALNSEKN